MDNVIVGYYKLPCLWSPWEYLCGFRLDVQLPKSSSVLVIVWVIQVTAELFKQVVFEN